MNIVIVGIGKFGKLLTKHLSDENHNIVCIDRQQYIIDSIVNECDVMGYVGNGASYQTLVEASVLTYDLLIATTPDDETNILCCLVAKKAGIKQTIARVRNPEYSMQTQMMHGELGISEMLNPDLDTANEIFRIMRFPSALKVETFANGKVDLVEIKLDSKSPLVGKSLFQIRERFNLTILVCAVKRGEEVIIPNGDFVLNENDNVYITGDSAEIEKAFRKFNIYKDRMKNVIIIGGGNISYYLAEMLLESGVFVKLIDNNIKKCEEFADAFPKVLVLNGDANNQSLLLKEGVSSADCLVSLTGFDETNIIVSTFAKSVNCSKIITKVSNTNYGLVLERVGIDSVVSPVEIFANNIIRYVRGMQGGESRSTEFKTLYRLVGNKVEAIEFVVDKPTSYTSVPIKDLHIKKNYLLACIIRENKVIIPSGKDTIEPLDSIIIITANPQLNDVGEILP